MVKVVLETVLEDRDEAITLQQLLNEMGYKTSRHTRVTEDDERKTPLAETRLAVLILRYARTNFGSRSFAAVDFEDHLINHGYVPSSATAILSGLVHEGTIDRIERGRYRLIPKETRQ
jgi:hypothetical protein